MSDILYFKLFANCIPVRGESESVIMDLQRGEYFPIPNKLMDVLELTQGNLSVQEIKNYFDNEYDQGIEAYFSLFEENEYGFYTDEPELFPEISTEFEFPSRIISSVICLDQTTKFNIHKVLCQLENWGCQTIQIRILDTFSIRALNKALQDISESDIKIIELFIPDKLATNEELIDLMHTSLRVSIVVYSSAFNKKIRIKRHKDRYVSFIRESIGKETKELYAKHLMYCNVKFYSESVNFNAGLNRKISIDESGQISNYIRHKD